MNANKTNKVKSYSAAVLTKLKKLKKLILEEDSKCWQIGDICIDLMETYRLSVRQISDYTDYSKARISHFHLTARIFPAHKRKGYTFQDSLTARQIYQQLPRLHMTPVQIRKKVVRMKNKTPRKAREYFVKYLLEKELKQTFAKSARYSMQGNRIINQCHHADWQQIVPKLPDHSVRLFIADPPFGGYGKNNKGGYKSQRVSTNGMRYDCDNGLNIEEALAVTLPLFELCHRKLAPNGFLLLFQPGGKPDRIEVLSKADECGWDCIYALTWQKGHLSTGNNLNPYKICSEKILVFIRKGDKVTKSENGLPHPDILNYPTETQSATLKMNHGKMKLGDYHIFQN